MKKFILFVALVLPILGFSQTYNAFVAQGIVSPSPLLPLENNGTGQVSFIVGNSATSPIPVFNPPLTMVITLSRGVPNVADPNNVAQVIASISGTFASHFTWQYDPGTTSFFGTQNQVIPGASIDPMAPPSAGTIIIPYRVTANSPITLPQNGFNVNLQIPGELNQTNATDDDKVSSYTWTSFYVTGNVFNDANGTNGGLIDGTLTDGTPVNTAGTLFVSLLDASNAIVATVPVNDEGGYEFFPTAAGNYSVVLHTTAAGSATSANLTNWDNTAEGLINPGDGMADGVIAIVLSNTIARVENANFGIEQLPETEEVEVILDEGLSMGDKYILGNMPLNGSDPEDGAPLGSLSTGYTFLITKLPTNAKLFYLGTEITAADVAAGTGTALIAGYDPTKLEIAFTVVPETNVKAIFEYASVDAAGLPDPSPATYTLTVPSILPAEGLALTATRNGNLANLSWSTLSEQQTSHFIVERSADGRKYTKIGNQVAAAGNSNKPLQYQLTDNNATAPVLFYRVKLVDIDGKTTHSNVVLLRAGIEMVSMKIFPNPATDFFYISINASGRYRIQMIDGSGKIVNSQDAQMAGAGSTFMIKRGALAAGNYQVKITGENGLSKTLPLIIAK